MGLGDCTSKRLPSSEEDSLASDALCSSNGNIFACFDGFNVESKRLMELRLMELLSQLYTNIALEVKDKSRIKLYLAVQTA